jgi:hypothetical protein
MGGEHEDSTQRIPHMRLHQIHLNDRMIRHEGVFGTPKKLKRNTALPQMIRKIGEGNKSRKGAFHTKSKCLGAGRPIKPSGVDGVPPGVGGFAGSGPNEYGGKDSYSEPFRDNHHSNHRKNKVSSQGPKRKSLKSREGRASGCSRLIT